MQVNFKGGIFLSPKAANIRSFYASKLNTGESDGLSSLKKNIQDKDADFIINKYFYEPKDKVCTCEGILISDGKVYNAYYNSDYGKISSEDEYKTI